jgi:hypothetical protein
MKRLYKNKDIIEVCFLAKGEDIETFDAAAKEFGFSRESLLRLCVIEKIDEHKKSKSEENKFKKIAEILISKGIFGNGKTRFTPAQSGNKEAGERSQHSTAN